jgi:hypothetical protein
MIAWLSLEEVELWVAIAVFAVVVRVMWSSRK